LRFQRAGGFGNRSNLRVYLLKCFCHIVYDLIIYDLFKHLAIMQLFDVQPAGR